MSHTSGMTCLLRGLTILALRVRRVVARLSLPLEDPLNARKMLKGDIFMRGREYPCGWIRSGRGLYAQGHEAGTPLQQLRHDVEVGCARVGPAVRLIDRSIAYNPVSPKDVMQRTREHEDVGCRTQHGCADLIALVTYDDGVKSSRSSTIRYLLLAPL